MDGRLLRRLNGPGLPASGVARLRVRMLEELGGEDPGPLLDATGAFLDRRLGPGRHFTSVAEDEGRLVGIASLEVFESLPGVPPVGTTRLGRELSPGGLPEVQAHSHDFLVLAYVERSEASPCWSEEAGCLKIAQ